MYISTKDWKNYINKLSQLNKDAANAVVAYVQKNGFSNTDALIEFSNAVVQKYGTGSAALSAAMYDAVAEVSGQFYAPAEMAEVADYGQVAKTVNGVLKRSQNVNMLGSAVGRLVKQAGADTTLQNAYRDRPRKKYGKKRNTGAQVAWVPMGDTCPFCLTLASRGWQNQTKGGADHHAEHIHANCDCTYAVRFDNHSGVAGYDPDEYYGMFQKYDGTWEDKINAMRLDQYQDPEIHTKILAQKRVAYEERNRKLSYGDAKDFLRKNGKISARPVLRFKDNNLYVADDVRLTNSQIRWINNRITKAKSALNLSDECDVPIVVVNDEGNLASYNPRTNILYISSRMYDEKEVLKLQKGYAAPDNVNSTIIHELFHWLDAEDYRKNIGTIESAEPKSKYSIYQMNKAFDELEKAGINLADEKQIRSISLYAYKKALANNFEEVYTEYRTANVCNGMKQ